MANTTGSTTSVTLLTRLRDEAANQAVWTEFVARYGPQINRWCRKWHLQAADAEDVTQMVLTRLATRLSTFRYDPARSFRAYLKTLAHYAWRDLLEERRSPAAGSGDSAVVEQLQSVPAGEDLLHHLEEEFDRELLEEAMRCVQKRVAPHTWKAFHLMAIEGLAGAEVAERLTLKVATVFKARSKVQKMLQEEVTRLEGP